ncbi:MAG: tRNA (adenosine(37)-N6)-dimethylallyltransferase MiaA [Clostridia bacterium]|nr:tRNA (adenosine(37)-N6)-dimethylallyltransferase MiaA [Clostridia bacterium]
MTKKKIICIVGPTGVGKTSISLELAKMFNGEIISADSMQIYRAMDIGTAKIKPTEMKGIKHHLIDIVDPTETFSVAEWKNLAEQKIEEISNRGKVPFIVGGTGLYINALVNNYKFYNIERNQETTLKYEQILSEQGVEKLYSMLQEKDQEFARTVDPKKSRAIIRYLEILDAGEVDLKIKDEENNFDYCLIGLTAEREKLYANINERVDKMFTDGLEEEVKNLVKTFGLNQSMQSANAIGYREFWGYLNGETTKDEMISLIKQHSRNYAKRQLTFMRTMKNLEWYERSDEEKIKARVDEFLNDLTKQVH